MAASFLHSHQQGMKGMSFFIFLFIYFLSFVFLELHLLHVEVPRLGVELELQLLVYTTAIATPDPNHICDLHNSSWQCWILNPLIEARDRTCVLMVRLSHDGNSGNVIFLKHLPCARHCARCFPHFISYDPRINPLKYLSLLPFH